MRDGDGGAGGAAMLVGFHASFRFFFPRRFLVEVARRYERANERASARRFSTFFDPVMVGGGEIACPRRSAGRGRGEPVGGGLAGFGIGFLGGGLEARISVA